MKSHPNSTTTPPMDTGLIDRRGFIYQLGSGVGAVALSWLLNQNRTAAATPGPNPALNPILARPPHFPARAKSCIFLMMEGGASHMDTFDPKPKLRELEGKVFKRDEKQKSNQNNGDRFFTPSPFQFQRYGQCGMDVSELFRHTASRVDDLAFIRSVYAQSDNHPAALFQFLTGQAFQGSPSIGSWVVYGLGTVNQNLPAFIVLRDGQPFGGTATWGNAYLPTCYQGTQLRSGAIPILDLQPPKKSAGSASVKTSTSSNSLTANTSSAIPPIPTSRRASPVTNSPSACRRRCPGRSPSTANRSPFANSTDWTRRKPRPSAPVAFWLAA